jgi:hypothetical protein
VAEDEDANEHEADDDDFDLTPEQREQLRTSMENLRRSLAPKFDFKLRAFKLPESTLKSFTAISGIAAQQSKMFESLKPMLDVQSAWQKQFKVINSDIFKGTSLAQSNLNLIASQLTRNVDFGLSKSFSRIAEQFAAQQSAWLKSIGPTLERLKASFYPRNLRGIEGLKFEEVEQVVMLDGIPLYGVPRTSIAEALIRAEGAAKRREILGRRWKAISADCRAAVVGSESEAVVPYAPAAVAALDALDSGHSAAAQALAGSLLDSIVNTYFGQDRYKYTPNRKTKTIAAYDEFTVREFIAFAPIWQAWQRFFASEGDPIPTTFSRNATAHTVSPKQFSRRNAVQGLMLGCSLLFFLDEQAARRQSA